MFAPWHNARHYTRLHTTEHEVERMIACWLKAFTAFAPVSVTIAYYPLFYLDFTIFYPKLVSGPDRKSDGSS